MSRFIARGLAECSAGVWTCGVALFSTLNSGDTAWIFIATALVLFMTIPGLAMFYFVKRISFQPSCSAL